MTLNHGNLPFYCIRLHLRGLLTQCTITGICAISGTVTIYVRLYDTIISECQVATNKEVFVAEVGIPEVREWLATVL